MHATFVDRGVDTPVTEARRDVIAASSLRPPPHVAICLTGQARTFTHPLVLHNHDTYFLKPLRARSYAVELFAVLSQASYGGAFGSTNKRLDAAAMAKLGGNRSRVEQGLRLLQVRAYLFREDLGIRPELNMACNHSLGFGVGAFQRDLEDCGVMVREHEELARRPFDWVVRTRPDAFFTGPFHLPQWGQYPPNAVIGKGDDSFAVVARDAVPGYFSLWQLTHICALFSVPARKMNHTIARLLPRHLRCGEPTIKIDVPGCVVRLTSWLHRFPEYTSSNYIAETNSSWGRRFVRSCVCNLNESKSVSGRQMAPQPPTSSSICITDWSYVRQNIWDPLWGPNICVYWPIAPMGGGSRIIALQPRGYRGWKTWEARPCRRATFCDHSRLCIIVTPDCETTQGDLVPVCRTPGERVRAGASCERGRGSAS